MFGKKHSSPLLIRYYPDFPLSFVVDIVFVPVVSEVSENMASTSYCCFLPLPLSFFSPSLPPPAPPFLLLHKHPRKRTVCSIVAGKL